MDSKKFKKILKESLSTGATSLFEQEDDFVSPDDETEEIERLQDEKEESSELMDYAEAALPSLEKTQQEINSLESEMKISPENFARAFAYYYVSIYHNDDSKWKYTIATPARYRTLMSTLLDGTKTNIVCEYVNIIKLAKKEKMFENPMNFLKDLQSLAPDKEVFMAISSVLESVHDGKYDLDSSNSKIKTSFPKLRVFDPNKCKSMEAPAKTAVQDQAKEDEEITLDIPDTPQILSDFFKELQQMSKIKDYAFLIFQALGEDLMGKSEYLDKNILQLRKEQKAEKITLEKAPQILEILKKIAAAIGNKEAKMVYINVIKFLNRNKVFFSPSVKQQFRAANLTPSKKRFVKNEAVRF